ncbi:MAG TPA: acetate/propionate family kinase, partial [Chitinophagaceae bacterium]|nr:acetate/propionate family kinase [Chitinophagaceae bacterium]
NIGQKNCNLAIHGREVTPVRVKDMPGAARYLLTRLLEEQLLTGVTTVTHRIVQGLHYTKPQVVTPALLKQLEKFTAFDPTHLPGEIMLIKAVAKYLPGVRQAVCFDTAFHAGIPQVAQMLPLPQAYYKKGIKRYGFHGLSYTYIMYALKKTDRQRKGRGRVVIAHLGNGASITAVKNGKSVDTSMGFTPAGGLVMGTRTGDLDPGVAWYIMAKERLSPTQFNTLINRQSGLLGVSGISADMQQLLAAKNAKAKQAVNLFCYSIKKYIGAYAAVLQGLDTLVFTGGIGANAAEIRHAACKGLQHLGIDIDKKANKAGSTCISSPQSAVKIYVIPADEELMMARLTKKLLLRK